MEIASALLKCCLRRHGCFITAAWVGGTGTGFAAPNFVRWKIAREMGIPDGLPLVTKPFPFEGRKRMQIAEEGIPRAGAAR